MGAEINEIINVNRTKLEDANFKIITRISREKFDEGCDESKNGTNPIYYNPIYL